MGDNSELVGLQEIAERAGVTKQAVWGWSDSKSAGFPEPLARLAAGPVWRWADVEAWLEARKKLSRPRSRRP